MKINVKMYALLMFSYATLSYFETTFIFGAQKHQPTPLFINFMFKKLFKSCICEKFIFSF